MVFTSNEEEPIRDWEKWQRFINYIEEKEIKASIGIIGKSMEELDSNYVYIKEVQDLHNSGTIEFWNHGYDHGWDKKNGTREFYKTPYDYQKDHLTKTQKLAKEKLDITLHTFGAPFNSLDENTTRAIDELDDIKVLFCFSGKVESNKFVLRNLCKIENRISKSKVGISFEQLNSCDLNKDYLVLQLHPTQWDNEAFEEFQKIIDYLIKENVTFTTPYGYYELKVKGRE